MMEDVYEATIVLGDRWRRTEVHIETHSRAIMGMLTDAVKQAYEEHARVEAQARTHTRRASNQ